MRSVQTNHTHRFISFTFLWIEKRYGNLYLIRSALDSCSRKQTIAGKRLRSRNAENLHIFMQKSNQGVRTHRPEVNLTSHDLFEVQRDRIGISRIRQDYSPSSR